MSCRARMSGIVTAVLLGLKKKKITLVSWHETNDFLCDVFVLSNKPLSAPYLLICCISDPVPDVSCGSGHTCRLVNRVNSDSDSLFFWQMFAPLPSGIFPPPPASQSDIVVRAIDPLAHLRCHRRIPPSIDSPPVPVVWLGASSFQSLRVLECHRSSCR